VSIKDLRKLLREANDAGWSITIQPADGSGITVVSAWQGKNRSQAFAIVDRDPVLALVRVAAHVKSI
jgi:hypothetical protein